MHETVTDLKPGLRLRSAVCTTEIVVVRAPAEAVDLRCGGYPLLPVNAERSGYVVATDRGGPGSKLGKRYGDPRSGLEVLCTKPGAGTLTVDGERLPFKDAKRLPSSD